MKIVVEVVYALPGEQDVVQVRLDKGAPVEAALKASAILERHPDIDLKSQRIGVWGRPVTLATVVRDGDRIEIYRALSADPKQVRRLRAARDSRRRR
ncbi:MAG TPA: RnfH family protein [Burkholderiales bacterium]|jgi:putative ubiquitin-RnfH superfamily antitoxin RatB of RatAB toxin-antitoxin module|nr:RnfH family protein [Burkholderiales bacterium]